MNSTRVDTPAYRILVEINSVTLQAAMTAAAQEGFRFVTWWHAGANGMAVLMFRGSP